MARETVPKTEAMGASSPYRGDFPRNQPQAHTARPEAVQASKVDIPDSPSPPPMAGRA